MRKRNTSQFKELSARRFLVFIVGTRAQLIKVAPVIVACEKMELPLCMLMTGQHQETMDDLIVEFGIRTNPTMALEAKERATMGSLLRWIPSAYLGVRACLRQIRTRFSNIDVIVHGDTLSAVLGAFVGWRCGGRVIHLESGLTSRKLFDPFPEEISRRIVFLLARVAMCPNPSAVDYMRNHHRCEVVDTCGNTILDSVAMVGAFDVSKNRSPSYFVVSLHRFQNIYDGVRLRGLLGLIEAISAIYPVYFVLHPATRKRLIKEKLLNRLEQAAGVVLSPRLGYGDFLRLAAGATCVLTDGGSNQEELAALGIPTIVMRAATERPDGIGANVLMEGDIKGSMEDFILEGKFHNLAVPCAVMNKIGPSSRVAQFLANHP
jgi:UDP-N-acetylglucosamine 2-epimerase (non-hydrolysing)